jgi:hypothetical protein
MLLNGDYGRGGGDEHGYRTEFTGLDHNPFSLASRRSVGTRAMGFA